MLLPGQFLCELGKRASKNGVYPNAVPVSPVNVMHASTDAFGLAWIWRGLNRLRCIVFLGKGEHFQPSYTAPRRNVNVGLESSRAPGAKYSQRSTLPLPHTATAATDARHRWSLTPLSSIQRSGGHCSGRPPPISAVVPLAIHFSLTMCRLVRRQHRP